MATHLMMATPTTMVDSFFSWTNLGYTFVILGLIATWFSTHRYLLAYFVAGMAYWMVVEGLQNVAVTVLPVSHWHGYVLALTVSWLTPAGFFVYRYLKTPSTHAVDFRTLASHKEDTYIEHTPIYNNYTPRFRG